MAGNGTSQLWKSVSNPVMVGLVWNLSHKLSITTQVATVPIVTHVNHINLKLVKLVNFKKIYGVFTSQRKIYLPEKRNIAKQSEINALIDYKNSAN